MSFGGTDPTGETAKVLGALSSEDFDGLVLDVVVGDPKNLTTGLKELVETRPNTTLHVSIPSLAPLLAQCDLAIGASGAATWERIAAAAPALVATVAPHQSGVTSALADAGLTHWVGLNK